MSVKDKNILDSVIYNYTAKASSLEGENKILKDTIKKLNKEIEKFQQPPLMVCEIFEVHGESAIIKIPNGNQFQVKIAKSCGKVYPGDMVLTLPKV